MTKGLKDFIKEDGEHKPVSAAITIGGFELMMAAAADSEQPPQAMTVGAGEATLRRLYSMWEADSPGSGKALVEKGLADGTLFLLDSGDPVGFLNSIGINVKLKEGDETEI